MLIKFGGDYFSGSLKAKMLMCRWGTMDDMRGDMTLPQLSY